MKASSIISLIFLIFLISLPVVQAEDFRIDLTDVDFTKNFEILVYNSTGKYVGSLKDDGNITLNSTADYMFVVKPTAQSWFTDPLKSIEFLRLIIPIYLNYFLFLVAFICGLVLLKRLVRS